MRCKIILLVSFSWFSINCFAQNQQTVDSLKKVILTLPKDTSKIFAYIKLGRLFENNNIDSALFFYQKAGSISKEINSVEGELKYIANYSAVLNILGKYDQSLALNFKSYILAKKIKSSKNEAIALTNIAVSYQYNDELFKSLEYYLKALLLFEKIGVTTYLPQIYSNVCGLYMSLNQPDEALKYALTGLQLNIDAKDISGICGAYINLGNAYKSLKKYDEALAAQKKAYQLASQINNYGYKANACVNIADIYLATNRNKDELIQKYEEAHFYFKEQNDPFGQALSLRGIGIAFLNEKQCDEAKNYVSQALTIAKNANIQSEFRKGSLLLSDIELCLGDIDKYSFYRNQYDSINDIYNKNNALKNVQELEVKYEIVKKEKALAEKNLAFNSISAEGRQKDQMLIGLIIGIFLLIGILFFAFRFFKQKRKLNEQALLSLKAEQENLKLKSHLEGQEAERIRISQEMHDEIGSGLTSMLFLSHTIQAAKDEQQQQITAQRMGKLSNDLSNQMNEIIWSMNQEYNSLADLIAYVRQQISELIENANTDFDFEFPEIIPDAQLTGLQRRSLYLVIKESVNNALKYAQATKITLICTISSEIVFTIKDNGKGIPAGEFKQFGNGLRNMQHRMKEIGGKFIIQTKEGTAVSFSIPLIT